MKAFVALIVIAALAWFAFGSGGSLCDIDGDTVTMKAGDLDATFKAGESLMGDFMVFGGALNNHKNATTRVTFVVLSGPEARQLHSEYPDFHMCASPGAMDAQDRSRQVNLLPANEEILATLQEAMATYKKNLKTEGESISLNLEGRQINLEELVHRQSGEDLTAKMKEMSEANPMEATDYLITAASFGPASKLFE